MLGPDLLMIVHLLHRETDDVEALNELKFIVRRYRLVKDLCSFSFSVAIKLTVLFCLELDSSI